MLDAVTKPGPGKYERTPEIRQRNRISALLSDKVGKGRRAPVSPNFHGKPCESDCRCGRHFRTPEHNAAIGEGVRAWHTKKKQEQRKKERKTKGGK